MFIFILLLGVLPLVYTTLKLSKLRDVNVFDLLQAFTCLYYVAIPLKVLYWDLPELKSQYIHDLITPLYYDIFSFALVCVNLVWTKQFQFRYSPLNITSYMRYWDKRIVVKDVYVFLFIIFYLLLFIPLTNYSALTEDNYEGNVTFGYGLGVSFIERCEYVFLCASSPVFFLLNFKYLTLQRKRKYKLLSIFSLILGAICFFLGSKTLMTTSFLFVVIYYYSVQRKKITRKFIFNSLVVFVIIIIVIFPMSQSFRMIKQTVVLNKNQHGFVDIMETFININEKDRKLLMENYNQYQERSLNVYQALHWACTKEFRGDGKLTLMVYKYAIPQFMGKENEENILGDVYLGKGADIGESILTWYIADWGIRGVIVAIIHFIIVFFAWKCYKSVFMKLFHDPKIELLLIYFVFSTCIEIEENPAAYFHGFYSQWLITFLVYILVFKVTDLFSKSKSKKIQV